MERQPEPIARMVAQLSRLPGVGKKSAQRLAYYLISLPLEDVKDIASAIYTGCRDIRYCEVCGNYSVDAQCDICANHKRDHSQICVVRDPRDVMALERMHDYFGTYHVLHGTLSPMNGVGPDDIHIQSLLQRVDKGGVKEVILATNPDIEGEATASYISRLLKEKGVLVTRIAHGVPIGSDLEYADVITLSKAIAGRREM
ncbi:MAG: recombination mediator RecR [Eubacteriales bacterium]|nr:recombination mediator RecR [Eubacteriales bacterium]